MQNERFPFAGNDPATRERVQRLLRDSERLMWGMATRLNERYQLQDADVTDCVQNVRIYVWQRLPKYDLTLGTKLSTYVGGCCFKALRIEFARAGRRRQRAASFFVSADFDKIVGPDHITDTLVERLASDVLSDPDIYFTPAQSRVFCAKRDNPDVMHKVLSADLGYATPVSFSTMLTRIEGVIADLDIDGTADR